MVHFLVSSFYFDPVYVLFQYSYQFLWKILFLLCNIIILFLLNAMFIFIYFTIKFLKREIFIKCFLFLSVPLYVLNDWLIFVFLVFDVSY